MKHLGITLLALSTFLTIAGCKPDKDDDGGGNTQPTGPTEPADPAIVCPGDDEVRYVSDDPEVCKVVRFTCNEGESFWGDPVCGCGCELPDCPDASADLTYVSHDKNQCAAIRFMCEPGFAPWFGDCGCGCGRIGGEGDGCGGIMGKRCADGFFCAFASETNCGSGDQMGTCERRPEMCITLYKPVCGCDGRNYSNGCAAGSAGVSVLHDGECEGSAVQN